MSKSKKRKKRRVSAKELRETMSPTKDFDYVNPHDEEDIILVTAQRLSPGHLFQMNSSSLIKAYQQESSEIEKVGQNAEGETLEQDENEETDLDETKDEEIDPDELQKNILDNFDIIVDNVKYASEIACMAIIDPETGKRIYTKEDCMLYFLPDFLTKISNWALNGAKPKQGDNADDVDIFPSGSEQQEGSELEEEAE